VDLAAILQLAIEEDKSHRVHPDLHSSGRDQQKPQDSPVHQGEDTQDQVIMPTVGLCYNSE